MLDVSKFVGTTLNLVYELLFNHNIATVPGEAYGTSTSKFIRFGIGVERLEDISKSLDVINELLDYKNHDTSKLKEKISEYGYNIVL
jgi:aspartate aminotransferase/aminotransferase